MIMGGRPAVRLNKATGSGRWKGLGAWGPVCVLSVLIRACPMTARAYRACSAQTTLRPGVPCREHERRTGGGASFNLFSSEWSLWRSACVPDWII